MKTSLFFILVISQMALAQTEIQPLPQAETVATPSVTPSLALKPILFSGDFRYRLQSEKQEPKQQRKTQRLQLRLLAISEVHENLKVYLRLMTGTGANSGNQTMGDEKAPGMVRRSFSLDQGYFDYKPFENLNLYGGKMPQPLTFVGKNQIILDRDITLEGLGTKFKISFDESFQFFVQGGMFFLRENYDSLFNEDTSDNMLNVGQLGLQWKQEDWDITIGYGSFGFTGIRDTSPTSLTLGASGNGNTLDASGNYPNNFDLREYFIEVKKKISGFDLSVFYESVKNVDVDLQNMANAFGFSVGHKDITVAWTHQEVQKDSVLALFSDSDFAGGQTSSRGNYYSINYKISKKVQMQYTVFNNENTIDTFSAKYDRNHIDLLINF